MCVRGAKITLDKEATKLHEGNASMAPRSANGNSPKVNAAPSPPMNPLSIPSKGSQGKPGALKVSGIG